MLTLIIILLIVVWFVIYQQKKLTEYQDRHDYNKWRDSVMDLEIDAIVKEMRNDISDLQDNMLASTDSGERSSLHREIEQLIQYMIKVQLLKTVKLPFGKRKEMREEIHKQKGQ